MSSSMAACSLRLASAASARGSASRTVAAARPALAPRGLGAGFSHLAQKGSASLAGAARLPAVVAARKPAPARAAPGTVAAAGG